MARYTLTLDLKNDPALIAEYELHHKKVWPEIKKSIMDSGITEMEIYRYQTRLFMIVETVVDFSFEKKKELDLDNAKVAEWEELMWKYQEKLPNTKEGEKWMLMDQLFKL